MKKRAKQTNRPAHTELMTVNAAAKACNINRNSLDAAIGVGRVPGYPTACGLPLVVLSDVQEYAENRPSQGRPKKTDEVSR